MDLFSNNECIVCGTATSTRCSGCRKVAFCGPAHQKIMWPIHKCFCGKEGYTPPPLTKEEIDWALSHPDPEPERDVPTLIRYLKKEDPTTEHLSANSYCLLPLPMVHAFVRNSCHATYYPGYTQGATPPLRLSVFAWLSHPESSCYSNPRSPRNFQEHLLLSQVFIRFSYATALVLRASWGARVGGDATVQEQKDWAQASLRKVDEMLDDLGSKLKPNLGVLKTFAGRLRHYHETPRPLVDAGCCVA